MLAAATAGGLHGIGLGQETLKIGLLATLEGPFAAPGQDGMRGADLALKQKNGMAGGKKIEFIKASSTPRPTRPWPPRASWSSRTRRRS
jgi:branched-chain amino acid transport system substrate-binding protein